MGALSLRHYTTASAALLRWEKTNWKLSNNLLSNLPILVRRRLLQNSDILIVELNSLIVVTGNPPN